MTQAEPILLTEIPGTDAESRLAVFLTCQDGVSIMTLAQQSWAEGIGWFSQSSIEIDPAQLPMLRQALGQGGGRPASYRPASTPRTHSLRVVG
ncbi:hypothetical protein K2Y11_12070 [bacterium]|nr:hypothetical protein [bacterium]